MDRFEEKENKITANPTLLHPSLVKMENNHGKCYAYTKEVLYTCIYVWWALPITCKRKPTWSASGFGRFFEDKDMSQGEWQYYKETNKGHGRLEVREIWASTQMNEWFGKN